MALTGTITINGGSAGAVFQDSGSINFSPFTKFSSFLSDQFSFTASSYTEIDSGNLTLISPKFGDLVATNTDTISASFGGDTVISGSVAINFVFGSATTSLFSTPYSDTLPGASSTFKAAASNVSLGGASTAFHVLDTELLKPATSATVPAAAASVRPTLAPTTGTQIDLGDAKATLVALHKPNSDKG